MEVFPPESDSSIESLPIEVLDHVYKGLKRSPWKCPLAQTSKTMYDAFLFHIERQEKTIEKSTVALRVAALRGDPILTRIVIPKERITFQFFVNLCRSGHLLLVIYFNANIIRSHTAILFYKKGIKYLLRMGIYLGSKRKEKREEILSYLMSEILLYHPTSQNIILTFLAGAITVHGKETFLYPLLKDLIEKSRMKERRYRIQTNIVSELFSCGAWISGLQHFDRYHIETWTTGRRNKTVYFILLNTVGSNDTTSLVKAYSLFEKFRTDDSQSIKEIENILSLTTMNGKEDLFLALVEGKPLDFERVWLQTGYRDKKYVEKWNLDLKKCLLCLLKGDGDFTNFNSIMGTFRRLTRHCPDILHLLTPEEVKQFGLGLFCPRCLHSLCVEKSMHPSKLCQMHRCTHCCHKWNYE